MYIYYVSGYNKFLNGLTTKCLHVNRVSVNCITKHGALKQVDNFLANVKIECHFYQISFSEK